MVGGRRSNWKAIAGSLAGLSVTCGCCSLLPIHPDSSLSLVPSITLLFFSGLPFYLCLLFPFFLFVPFLVFHPRSSVLCPSLALFPSWTFSSPPHYASRTTTFSPPPPCTSFSYRLHKYIYFKSVFLLVVSAYFRLLGFACFAAGFDAVVKWWWMTIII